MNIDLTWSELARVCGGELVRGAPQAPLASIGTDTRKLSPGQAFWALKGERTDGHDHLEAARGAAGWVAARGRPRPADGPPQVCEVPDTLKALHALAAWHRSRRDIPVAAVAGSNGKTSTKDMLASIASRRGPVCSTAGNLNNQFGLPLSVLELEPAHRYGVFELGESHPGDIAELAAIAKPTVGVLTNAGPAHLEYFGSMEAVFQCLTELASCTPDSTRIAVNLDDPWLAGLADSLGTRAITFGTDERAMVRLVDAPPAAGGERDGGAGVAGRVELVIERRRVSARLAAPGRVHRLNAAAAAAGAVGLGLGPDDVADGLEAFRPSPMRFEPRRHSSGAWLVADAYNANPASMRAGIESFIEAFPDLRRILALGDMKELGPDSGRMHRELGEWLAGHAWEAVLLAGPDMARAAQALRSGRAGLPVLHRAGCEELAAELSAMLAGDVAVYFKASRAMRMERLIDAVSGPPAGEPAGL